MSREKDYYDLICTECGGDASDTEIEDMVCRPCFEKSEALAKVKGLEADKKTAMEAAQQLYGLLGDALDADKERKLPRRIYDAHFVATVACPWLKTPAEG